MRVYADFNTDNASCPSCNAVHDAALEVTEEPGMRGPKNGDFAICFACGNLNVYDDKLGLREATEVERAEAPEEAMTIMTQVVRWRAKR